MHRMLKMLKILQIDSNSLIYNKVIEYCTKIGQKIMCFLNQVMAPIKFGAEFSSKGTITLKKCNTCTS